MTLKKDVNGKYPPWWNSILCKSCWLALGDLIRDKQVSAVWHIATRLQNLTDEDSLCSEDRDEHTHPLLWALLIPDLFGSNWELLKRPTDRSVMDFSEVIEELWAVCIPECLMKTRRLQAAIESKLSQSRMMRAKAMGAVASVFVSWQMFKPLVQGFLNGWRGPEAEGVNASNLTASSALLPLVG